MDFFGPMIVSFLLLIIFNSLAGVEAQGFSFCGDYNTTRSSYRRNLDSVLSSLPADIAGAGFFSSSAGQDPDRVTATALCRADVQSGDCRDCVGNATSELVAACPFNGEAISYRNLCVVRFSNRSIAGALAVSPGILLRNNENASDAQRFSRDLGSLLDDLRALAAGGGPLLKAAAGNRTTGPGNATVYALVQCTPDISAGDCDLCLLNATQRIPAFAPVGFRALFPSCNLRYEATPFFNLSRIQEVETLSVSPSQSPAGAPPPPSSPSPTPTQLTPGPQTGAPPPPPPGL
ncbi:hypothetical protein M569_08573 [Genlisea aurea]|uniref:Gnk2-homologous domain-containing protein n=1 Tax=Genlisea aurea TaxID=192259 RepID=S8CGU6_9LAMI|nr:hypothetical protein M569_08573 [Genlisea aurea]